MKLIVTEKNDAAGQIARLLSDSGKPKADKVYDTSLKAYGDEDGIQSYGTVVDLLVAYYR